MRAIIVQTLVKDVDITLSCEDDGSWKFMDWSRNGVALMTFRPSADDCARRFATLKEALEHFRREYGEQLRFVRD